MIFVFILTLTVSFTVVRIGAIAFQLTGLEWSLAKFQSLSCFTGTGFTTKEAELITGNPQRRKIASVLMVLGNAGLVILIATFASSLVPSQEAILSRLSESFLPFSVPPFLVIWINLAIIIVTVYILYKVFTNQKLTMKLTNSLRRKIIRREIFKRVSFEELLVSTGGYGVTRVEVSKSSPVLDKTLIEANIRALGVNILAIVRGDRTIPNPSADSKILFGDELICFGKLENIRNKICEGI